MSRNEYIPFLSEITEIIKHTDIEYTFRMSYSGQVNPGQFFEVSIPKFGEAPISVSGIGADFIDLTIRRVGKVTNEIFEQYAGGSLYLRGPYGNGFCTDSFRGKELAVIAGGTGLSPVRGVIEHFWENPQELKKMKLIAGFRSPEDILFRNDISRWSSRIDVTLTVDSLEKDYEVFYNTGLVTEYIPEIGFEDNSEACAVAVGPPAMMHFTVLALLKAGFKKENIWISYERRMCCGIGKCGRCKISDKYVCLDGPVFNYSEAASLID